MKRIALAIGALCIALSLGAQQPSRSQWKQGEKPSKEEMQKKHQEMKNRLESEHVAYLTSELELTTEEAQNFWPVYNKAQAEQKECFNKMGAAKKALKLALKENQDEAQIKKALSEYNKVRTSQRNVFAEYESEFVKVLGVVKTAKLYIAEDSFRTRQIHRLGDGKGRGPQPGGMRPHGDKSKGDAKSQSGRSKK